MAAAMLLCLSGASRAQASSSGGDSATDSGGATPYELKSTNISGSAGSRDIMLTAPVAPGAAAYKTESGIYLYPTLTTVLGYNDNLLQSSNSPVASSVAGLRPEVVAELKTRGDRYTASAMLDMVRYGESGTDNYTKSDLRLAADNYYSIRARSALSLNQASGVDARGSTDRPNVAEPDRWSNTGLNGRFVYGANEAKGRIELDAGYQNKVYDNNRATTALADVAVSSLAGRFYYRLGTRTMALAEWRNDFANYASSLSNNSNVERRYYAGLTWEATAATTGVVKLGQLTKDFGSGARTAFSGGSWEAAVRWSPRTYSTVDFKTSRATADASGFGDYKINTGTDVVWNHQWGRGVSSLASVGLLNAEYAGSGVSRTDDTSSYSVGLNYQWRRWARLGVSYTGTERTSNAANASFRRNVTMFTLDASL